MLPLNPLSLTPLVYTISYLAQLLKHSFIRNHKLSLVVIEHTVQVEKLLGTINIKLSVSVLSKTICPFLVFNNNS